MSPSAITTTQPTTAPPAAVPSSQRCEPGSVNIPIAKWPKTAQDGGPVDPLALANDIVAQFNALLAKAASCPNEAAQGLASLFTADVDCYWRDHLALSWDLRTLKSRPKVAAFVHDHVDAHAHTRLALDTSTPARAPKLTPFNPEQTCKGIVFFVRVETKVGRGHGVVRLAQEEQGTWRIWTLFTTLEELKGFEEPVGPRRPAGVAHGIHKGRKNWLDRRREEENFVNSEPDVLILGKSIAVYPILFYLLCVPWIW